MTREDAIKRLEYVKANALHQMDAGVSQYWKQEINKTIEVIDMSIEALQKADRKTEPNCSEIPNNCEKCKWWNESYGCHWKEGVCHYVPIAIIPKQCVPCDSASRIIEAYSQGFRDGAKAVKAMPQDCLTCRYNSDEWDSPKCDGCSKAHSNYEPQTDCSWQKGE